MSNKRLAVFCDFDGTVSRRDVGYNIFNRFSGGRNNDLLPDWKSGRMTSREILTQEAEMSPVTAEELYPYLDTFDLDPGFPSFVARLKQERIDLFLVSDGFDLYINYLLRRHDLNHLHLITNHGRLEDGYIKIEFPHVNRECKKCGSCKGERIREYRAHHDGPVYAVFIGDGFSDACGAEEADLVFAKKDLERYCRINNIDCVAYDDFFDVTRHMESNGLLKT